jgi:hypothetical protein
MLKKLALPVIALVMLLSMASAPAQAAVRFGVTIGPSPVYTYPAYPYSYDPYAPAYVDPYYATPNYYYAPAPVYVAPSFSFGWGGGHRDHDRYEYRGNNFRGHDDHGRGNFNGGTHGGHRR